MILLKATLLWSALLLATRALRSSHPADRHRLWTIGFAALLALPMLVAVLPALDVPVNASWAPSARLTPSAVVTTPIAADPTSMRPDAPTPVVRTHATDAIPSPVSVRPFRWPPIESVMIGVWAVGTVAAVFILFVSLIRVRRLKATASELRDPDWTAAARTVADRFGVHGAIHLFVDDGVRVPMAGGVRRPAVYLPRTATTWAAERRDLVLAHEIAHLAGRDPLRLIAARLAVALYWFHPLAWIAARQSGADLEEACDAAVLALGTRPSAYANLLLEFADSIRSSAPLAALPIVQRSLLERRLMAILRDERHTLRRMRLFLPALLGLTATISIAAAQPVGRTPTLAPSSFVSNAIAPASPVASPSDRAAEVSVRRDPTSGDVAPADSACWSEADAVMDFSGTITRSGREVTTEIGTTHDGVRVIEESLDGVQVCMIAEGVGEPTRDERPSEWLARSPRVVIESRQSGRTARLTLTRQGGGQQVSWTVNGAQRTFDAAAAEWRGRMLAVLDNIWALSALRGEVSTLRGQISTVYGEESTLRGRISTFEGEVSTMRGRQSTIRGQESTLRGQISSIRGHISSLRGEISSEQGEISSLESWSSLDRGASLDARIARHNENITQIEHQIRDYDEAGKIAAVQQRIKDLDVDGKIAAIDAQIKAFDLDGKIAAVDQQINDLDVDGKVAAIQKQIAALDADRRGRELETQRDAALRQLEAALDRIK